MPMRVICGKCRAVSYKGAEIKAPYEVVAGYEGKRLGFKDVALPRYIGRPQVSAGRIWRRETVTVRGKPQVRYRDLGTGRFIKKP